MGVWKGRTINFIAGLNPHNVIYGFDSFTGLPEDWNKQNWDGTDRIINGKIFATNSLPLVLKNVVLKKGLFKDSLPKFYQKHKNEKISFLHIDCDIYSSTKDVFDILGNMIVPGTIIVFDEYYHYPTFKEHEYKAFQEFIKSRKDISFKYIAYNPYHEQVAVKIVAS